MLRGNPLKIVSPRRKVDWLYVEDLVRGLLTLAVAPGLEGESVDLGLGELVEICDVVHRIQRLIDPRAMVEFGTSPERAFEQVRYADTAANLRTDGMAPENRPRCRAQAGSTGWPTSSRGS